LRNGGGEENDEGGAERQRPEGVACVRHLAVLPSRCDVMSLSRDRVWVVKGSIARNFRPARLGRLVM
jgi:hypothetical protein